MHIYFTRLRASALIVVFFTLSVFCSYAEVSVDSIREKSNLFAKNPVKVTSYRESVEYATSGESKGESQSIDSKIGRTITQWPYYLSEAFSCDLIKDTKDVSLETLSAGDYQGATLIIKEDLYKYDIHNGGRSSDVSKRHIGSDYLSDPGTQYPYAPSDSLEGFKVSRLTTGTVLLRKKVGQQGEYLETWRFLNEYNGWLSEYTMDRIEDDGRLIPVNRKAFNFYGSSKLPNGIPPELIIESFNNAGQINSRIKHVSLKVEFLPEPLKPDYFKLRIDENEVKYYNAKTGKSTILSRGEFDKIYE